MIQFRSGWAQVVWGLMDFIPNKAQDPIIYHLVSGIRFLLVCGGERAGKSFITIAMALLLMQPDDLQDLSNCPKKLAWIIGPDYNQARAEFTYLYETLQKGGMIAQVSMPNNITAPWSLTTTWNFKIETKTSSDSTKISSFAPDFVLMVEAAQQEYNVWLRARGRVMQKRGQVIMSGTLEGEKALPWYGDLLKHWKGPNTEGGRAFSLPTWSNTAVFPEGWDDPEIQALYEYHKENNILDYFYERYGAEPRKATGLVYPEFDWSTHVKELEVMEDVPVELWIDPGKNAYAVLFVQVVGLTCNVLDRVYRRGALAQDVIAECMDNPLWEQVKLNVGSHGVIDIAGRQQHGMPSHIEIWKRDAGIVLRSNYVHQDVGRDVVRYRLRKDADDGQPLLFFNANITNAKSPDGQAGDVLAEFELQKWKEPKTGSSEPRRPVDANNHATKALGYGLYDKFGPTKERVWIPKAQQRPFWNTM